MTDSVTPGGNGTPWQGLRRYTAARIAQGRVGASLPTAALLEFGAAHAQARDAVHRPLNVDALAAALHAEKFATVQARSRAGSRSEYLRRPDLGRQLAPECEERLRCDGAPNRLTVVLADGLSSIAVEQQALPVLRQLRRVCDGWELDAAVIATEARVALGDPIGTLRGAEAVAVLVGERPGLSAADSLGVYLTYAPRVGRSDAERNCISNVREGGMSAAEAVFRMLYLLGMARRMGQSGVAIKDASIWQGQLGPG